MVKHWINTCRHVVQDSRHVRDVGVDRQERGRLRNIVLRRPIDSHEALGVKGGPTNKKCHYNCNYKII